MKKGYIKTISYHFTVDNLKLAITDFSKDFIELEEVNKNGQYECHFYGRLCNYEGFEWMWDKDEIEYIKFHLNEWFDEKYIYSIPDYINNNGIPEDL